ncbi:Ger(x)C family spore germination protein [Bacillus thuringiensis]|uniref:Ger(x)C family spore germination protein n=1 Tax=Bacillus thuringiensis TaxID=1428 RepID=UPI000BFE4BB8|nr:Ger(x)C family spore germination protein [Bacillus thuringiensis]PGW30984.1 spore gernimation protein GerK [Bacillus thuringiensis]
MKKLFMCIVCIFLVGCWDQKPLKDSRLAYSLGYDLYQNKSLKQTVEIVNLGRKLTNEVYSSIKNTAQDTTDKIRAITTGDISYIKYGIQLYGKELEKRGISPTLDVAFRDPGNPTSFVRVISVDGLSSEILEKKKIGELLIGKFLTRKFKTLEERSYFPVENLESIFRKIQDKGEDFTLPSIKIQGKEIVTNGLALFHNDKLTGRLPLEHCVLFTLLKGEVGRKAHITKKINNKDYVSIEMRKGQIKQKMNVNIDKDENVYITIKLELFATVLEYSRGHLDNHIEKKRLSTQISKELTHESKEIINKLQKANCDAFGVGRQLIAYHPKIWKEFDYKKAKFDIKVDVNIYRSGVLN